MCRYTFLSMIFFFVFASAFLGIGVNQAIQEPTQLPNEFDLTATSIIATATANAQPSRTPNSFDLSATSIIGTATAMAQPTEASGDFGGTATSIIQTATAQAQPSRTIDPFALTATSIIQTATAMAQSTDASSQVKPSITPEGFGPTATALVLTANAQVYPTLDPSSLTNTAEARPSQTIDPFALTATSIIQTATAMAQPTELIASPDDFEMTATSIVTTATANAEPSEPFLPYPHTATAFAQTEAAIAIASPTPCQGFDWTFTYFAAEVSYGIDAHEITRHYCTETEFTLYAFEISIMDWEGSLSNEEFYMLFESSVGTPVVFPEDFPIRKPDISELILVTNFNTMQSWEFTFTDASNAWEEGLRGQELAEALGVELP